MTILSYVLVTFVILVVGSLIVTRLPPLVGSLLWLAVPLGLMPLWLGQAAVSQDPWSWFLWAKIWSVVLSCVWIGICCAWPRLSPLLLALTAKVLLGANMVEAISWDALDGNGINAAAGTLLVIVLLAGPNQATIVRTARRYLFFYDLSWTWLVGYTLWNACFVYHYFHADAFAQQVAVLGAGLALALLLGRQAWVHVRAITLGLFMVTYATFREEFLINFDSSTWFHPTILIVLAIASLGVAIVASAEMLWRRRTPRDLGAQRS